MFSGLFSQVTKGKALGIGVLVAAMVTCSGQAMAAGGGGRGGGGGGHWGGGHSGGGHGGWNGGHHDSHSHSSFSIGIGLGSWGCGPGWSTSFGYSSGYCGASYGYGYGYSYCAPRPYCPPVVVAPYCPPAVVVAPVYAPAPVVVVRDTYAAPSTVVVQRPVVVEKQVIVEKPVVVEKQVVVERPTPPQPTTPVVATAQPGTYRDRELGDAYLRIGDMENAARVYGRYLTAWDKDGTAVRNIGVAQIATGHPQEGFRNFVTGYKLEANLIDRPLRVQDVGGPNGFSKVLDQAVHSADSLNTADGWLTVAMLQQMNGQHDAAIASLQKSRDAGLDKDMLDSFTLALAK